MPGPYLPYNEANPTHPAFRSWRDLKEWFLRPETFADPVTVAQMGSMPPASIPPWQPVGPSTYNFPTPNRMLSFFLPSQPTSGPTVAGPITRGKAYPQPQQDPQEELERLRRMIDILQREKTQNGY